MVYAKVTVMDLGTYYYKISTLKNVLDEISEHAEHGFEPGDKWTIELVEMSEEEYEALPEFEGY